MNPSLDIERPSLVRKVRSCRKGRIFQIGTSRRWKGTETFQVIRTSVSNSVVSRQNEIIQSGFSRPE